MTSFTSRLLYDRQVVITVKKSLIKSVSLCVLFDADVYLKTMYNSLYHVPMPDEKNLFIIFYLVFVFISLLFPYFKENVEIIFKLPIQRLLALALA